MTVLSRQETIGHRLFQIGHSYEAFTYLFGRYIFIFLHSANKIVLKIFEQLRIMGWAGEDENRNNDNKATRSTL